MRYMILTILLVFYPLISYAEWTQEDEDNLQYYKKNYPPECSGLISYVEILKQKNISRTDPEALKVQKTLRDDCFTISGWTKLDEEMLIHRKKYNAYCPPVISYLEELKKQNISIREPNAFNREGEILQTCNDIVTQRFLLEGQIRQNIIQQNQPQIIYSVDHPFGTTLLDFATHGNHSH